MKLSDFAKLSMGYDLSEIKTGSELLLFGECQKYLNEYGVTLECDVDINERLLNGEYLENMIEQGVKVPLTCDCTTHEEKFYTDDTKGVEFLSYSDDEWVFNYKSNTVANRVMLRNRSKAYVSLLANLLTYRAMNNTTTVLKIAQGNDPALPEEYAHLLILQMYGNMMINDNILILEMCPAPKTQPIWEAYVNMNRQLGYMCRPYSNKEKEEYCTNNFEVGEVVLLYIRSKAALQDRKIRTLSNCFMGIIERIDNNGLALRYFPNPETYLTTRRRLDSKGARNPDSFTLLTERDYNNFLGQIRNFSWYELGIGVLLYSETHFITKLIDSDGSYQDIMTSDGIQTLFLNTIETVYAVLENRGISYDKDKFIKQYFEGKTPIYDVFRDLQPSKSDAINLSYAELREKYVDSRVKES